MSHLVIRFIAHLLAASLASTPALPAEDLLAISWVESRWNTWPVSRPHGARYPACCGPMQTMAQNAEQCAEQGSLLWGYELGRREMEQWLRDRRVRGNLRLALAGHGCGNAGIAAGTCSNQYERRVLAVRTRLRALLYGRR